MNRIFRFFLTTMACGMFFAPSAATADGKGQEARNPNRCPYSKSLFVNLTTDEYRKSQVALRVLGANVMAIGAEGHLFLADHAAILALDQACWPVPTSEEEEKLYEQRQCLQLGESDGVFVECDDSVPPVGFLLQQGVQVYGCAACMMDYLMESKCADDLPVSEGALEGVELVTPNNLTPFLNLYDRTSKRPRCDIDAAVISF